MAQDALHNYWSMLNGVTRVTKQKAATAAKALVAQGAATREQVAGLTENLVNTSKSNRDALASVVRAEIERALGRLGLARERDVEALEKRLRDLEAQVRELSTALPPAAAASQGTTTAKTRRPRAATTSTGAASTQKRASSARGASTSKSTSTPKSTTATKSTSTTKSRTSRQGKPDE